MRISRRQEFCLQPGSGSYIMSQAHGPPLFWNKSWVKWIAFKWLIDFASSISAYHKAITVRFGASEREREFRIPTMEDPQDCWMNWDSWWRAHRSLLRGCWRLGVQRTLRFLSEEYLQSLVEINMEGPLRFLKTMYFIINMHGLGVQMG